MKPPWSRLLGTLGLVLVAWPVGGQGALEPQSVSPGLPTREHSWTGLSPGEHPVGYRVAHLYDSERTFSGSKEQPRPVQVSVWYPASSVEGLSPLSWRDYLLTAATEVDFSEPDDLRRFEHLTGLRDAASDAGVPADRFESLLGQKTMAHMGAPPAAGRFPLVVFVPGLGAPAFQNTVALEYLASYGFVVASFPSVGTDSRAMTHDEAGATAQVGDIEFAMQAVVELAPVDPQRTALVGYSWGGMSVVLAAMSGVDVHAVISIDSTLMVKKGHALARTFEGYDPGSLEIPLLLLIADALQWNERDLSFFDEVPGPDVSLLRFHDLKHGDFASIIIRFFVHGPPNGGGRDAERIDAGYAAVCRYLLAFLDAHLREGSAGRAFLAASPLENGLPPEAVSVEKH